MSTASRVLRDLVGGPFRRKVPYVVIGVLLLGAVAVSAWVVWSDLSHKEHERGEEKPAEATVVPTFTLEELGRATWRVGELVPSKGGALYTAKVVDGQDRDIFDLKVNGTTGELVPRGAEEGPGASPGTAAPADVEALRAQVSEVLPQLALGQARTKGKGAFFEVVLTYQSKQLATLRVDPRTKTIIPKGERPAAGDEGPERAEGKKSRIVPGNLVQPLGWLAAMVAVVSTLYYSWRRAQTAIIRESSGGARALGIRRLRLLLRWHEAFGFLALGLAVLHLVNFWGKLQVSTSWLLFFMMVTVVLSGLMRDVTCQYQVVRTYWRTFHIPYTVLFFAVLAIHMLMKVGELGED